MKLSQMFLYLAAAAAIAWGAGVSDVTPPTLTAISFSPSSINTIPAPQTVTITATTTDDLSGVSFIYVTFSAPTSGQSHYVFLSRISGTSLNGTYQGTIQFPQFGEAGTWKLFVEMRDLAGNYIDLQSADLQAKGFPTSLTVQSTPDTQPPQIVGITMAPSSVDASAGPQTVTLSLSLTDNLSGTNFTSCNCSTFFFDIRSPSGNQNIYLSNNQFTQTSGTALNGVWRAQFTVPQFSEPGVWQVAYIGTLDATGNFGYFYTSTLQSQGLQTSINVASSPFDNTPPQLVALTFSPPFIDTSASSQSITVTLTATDDRAGVTFAPDTPNITNCCSVTFQSPSGGQSTTGGSFSAFHLVGGTPQNGTWQTQVSFPQYSEAGTWTLSHFSMSDATHNTVNFTTAALTGIGIGTSLDVTQPSGGVDGTIGPGGGAVNDQVFGSRASITIPSGLLSANTNISIDVLQSSFSTPTPQGYTGPGTRFVNLDLNPHPAGLLPAPGISITIPITTNPLVPGQHLVLYRIDPVTGKLVPAVSVMGAMVNGGMVIGTVNGPDGLSATFSGIASLSTVVGLIPTGAIPGDVNGDGKVDCADVAIVKAAFGTSRGQTGYDARADVNNDGVVNILDLAFVLRQLPAGTTCQ